MVLQSVRALLALKTLANEILLVDQTYQHPLQVQRELEELNDQGRIRWIRLQEPSIPKAMNTGLCEAKCDLVLFLDDDIVPDDHLVEMHLSAQTKYPLVAGMVLQPGERAKALQSGEAFRFNSDSAAQITEFMGGNFSIRRDIALSLGGFDENFVGAAYRFEAEFSYRYCLAHGPIYYEPRAMIHHLQVATGGTRAHGHHLRTLKPGQSVGAYYDLMRTRRPGWLLQIFCRPFRAVRTRHHLRLPWWIPLTFFAELRGLALAGILMRKGPKLISISPSRKTRSESA